MAIERNIEEYQKVVLETWEEFPPFFVTSSETALGKESVLEYIDKINESL